MNNPSSIKYFEGLKKEAKKNFDERFKKVSYEFLEDLFGEKPYDKDCQAVIGWMFELYKVNSTTFYTLFKKVMYGRTNLETLEGLEEMRSFVGNFFDDSCVKLVVNENRTYESPITEKEVKMPISPAFDWHLEWAHDDEETLSTKELIEVMRRVYEGDYEWCKKLNDCSRGDSSTKLDKYDLSLLKKELYNT